MDNQPVLYIAAERKNLETIRDYVQHRAEALGVAPRVITDVLLAADEAATNVIVHGYRGQAGHLEIELKREGSNLIIRLQDDAEPFDPTTLPAPDITLPPEERALGGLGVYMIRQVMDHVHHRVTPGGGNELIMVKRLEWEDAP